MKITSYFCDLCGSAIPTELVDDVKGLNIRVDLDHGAYESFVFQHACLSCRSSVTEVVGVMLTFLEQNPQYVNEPATNVLLTAITMKWCKK